MREKKVLGRKRHIAVDTQGNLLTVVITAADVQDRDAFWDVIDQLAEDYPTIRHCWVDGGYRGCADPIHDHYGITVEVVQKAADQGGFVALPRRWVVERTFAWLGRHRTLSKEWTHDERYSTAHMYLASWDRLLRRLRPHPRQATRYGHRLYDRKGDRIKT